MSVKQVLFLLLILNLACETKESKPFVFTLGDSNGALEYGWAAQLEKLRPETEILNISIPGNTIGFDNLGYQHLNSLRNIEAYLDSAYSQSSKLDAVIVLLGTNDSKSVFKDRQGETVVNIEMLLKNIQEITAKKEHTNIPILLCSPPPMGADSTLADKYKGGNLRVLFLRQVYQEMAEQDGIFFVDVYTPLKNRVAELSDDGVHFNESGQQIIAATIDSVLANVL